MTAVTYVESGKAPEHDGYGRYVTIDDLFDKIQEAIDGRVSQITATYDPEVGYPTDVRIDYDARMADEEYMFTASGYVLGTAVPDGRTDALREAQAELDTHRALWTSSRSNEYSFVLAPLCFCPQDLLDPVTVRVENGFLTVVTYVESGKAPEHDGYGRYVTIDDLFDTIQEAIDGKASQITATYDPEIGYPTDVRIDYDARIADEEYMFTASGYVPADGQYQGGPLSGSDESATGDGVTMMEVTVGPELLDCVGVGPRKCLELDGKLFYDGINGFKHEEGHIYRLKIERYDAFPGEKEPPQDASKYGYRLIEVISKTSR